MSTAIVKASKAVKGMNVNVLNHLNAVERAREIYLAQIKRAESEYFDRIKRATEIITGEEVAAVAAEASAPAPTTAPAAAPSPDAP
jgi:hypothetical protein